MKTTVQSFGKEFYICVSLASTTFIVNWIVLPSMPTMSSIDKFRHDEYPLLPTNLIMIFFSNQFLYQTLMFTYQDYFLLCPLFTQIINHPPTTITSKHSTSSSRLSSTFNIFNILDTILTNNFTTNIQQLCQLPNLSLSILSFVTALT